MIEEIYAKHYKELVRHSFKFTKDLNVSEELVQDVMFKASTMLDKINLLKPWLFIACRNASINYKKRNKEINMPDNRFFDSSYENEFEHDINTNFLPLEQKKVIDLVLNEGLSVPEISEYTKKPYDTVKSHYRLGLIKLKKQYEGQNGR